MSERRTPYTTQNKPRKPWLGETAAPGSSPPDTTIVSQDELDTLRQRLAALEAAARKVCDASEYPQGCGAAPGSIQRLAIKDLCRLVGEGVDQ